MPWPTNRVVAEFMFLCTFHAFVDCSAVSVPPVKPMWKKTTTKRLYAEPAGNTVRFQCHVVGTPTPVVTWFTERGPVSKYSRIGGYKLRKKGQVIVLESVVPGDSGRYMCKASNGYGSINRTFELTVHERTASTPLIVHGILHNETVYKGDNVVFKCQFLHDGYAHVEWLRSQKVGNETSIQSLGAGHVDNGSFYELLLKNVSLKDEGEYTCLAGNAIGISHASAWLKVVLGSRTERAAGRPQILFNFPPDKTVYVGDSIMFTCKMLNFTSSRMIWIHHIKINGSWLNPKTNRPYAINIKSRPHATNANMEVLLINEVTLEDAGEYVCLGANSVGITRRSTWLKVLPDPPPKYRRRYHFPDSPVSS